MRHWISYIIEKSFELNNYICYYIYTQRGNKLNFSNEVGGQKKDFAHPTVFKKRAVYSGYLSEK
jgi:hypothetical protein